MKGLMQEWPLLVNTFIDHAKIHHGEREIVTRKVEGDIHSTNYSEIHSRSKKFAKALKELGVKKGDVVGTLAWNTYRHLESWYGITGLGAIYHTLNPRLFIEQLDYIINHANNKFIISDISFVEILETLKDKIKQVKPTKPGIPQPGLCNSKRIPKKPKVVSRDETTGLVKNRTMFSDQFSEFSMTLTEP